MLEVALAPLLPVEVLDLLQLLQVEQLVLEPPVALPGHHPDVSPLVPQGLGPRVLNAALALAHARPATLPVEARAAAAVGRGALLSGAAARKTQLAGAGAGWAG